VARALDVAASIPPPTHASADTKTKIWLHGHDHALHASVFVRDQLGRDSVVVGPAIIVEAQSHCVIPPGMQASIGPLGEILIERDAT
jgi:N-methylhydantoinase A/oxoprolinase/acetone carboxylase beta subunit